MEREKIIEHFRSGFLRELVTEFGQVESDEWDLHLSLATAAFRTALAVVEEAVRADERERIAQMFDERAVSLRERLNSPADFHPDKGHREMAAMIRASGDRKEG